MVNKLLEYTDDTFRKEINTLLTVIPPHAITMKMVFGHLEDKLEIDLKDEGIRMHMRKLVMQCMDNKVPENDSGKKLPQHPDLQHHELNPHPLHTADGYSPAAPPTSSSTYIPCEVRKLNASQLKMQTSYKDR